MIIPVTIVDSSNFAATNFGINPVDITKGFVNLEKRKNIDNDVVNIAKGIIYNSMQNHNYMSCPQRFIKAYKDIKFDKDIHLTKADKSSAIVILDKCDYNQKMKIF